MKQALISPLEPVATGYRVAQVQAQSFDVAKPFFWIPCEDTVTSNGFFYDHVSKTISTIPASAVVVPQEVTRFQAKAALSLAGLLTQVETLMADPNTPTIAKLAWSDAQTFERTSPTIAAMAGALNMTSGELDALFTAAAGITA